MNISALNVSHIVKTCIAINFYISALVLVAAGVTSVTEYSIFQFNFDLYGALDNNLRMVLLYLAFSECFVVAYCFFSKKFQVMTIVGAFLILMIGSLAFYGEINAVEIDPKFPAFFLYMGISHILFGVQDNIEKTQLIN